MRLHILSDLHNEFGQIDIEPVHCDAVILAGDTNVGMKGANWALDTIEDVPIIYVTGNHEYYGKKLPKINKLLDESAQNTNLHFLDRNEVILDGVRFLGCTLWTDFLLYGTDKFKIANFEAQQRMTDYNRIRLGQQNGYRKLKPSDTIQIHHLCVQFLEKKLQEPFEGSTVIVTHHSPTPKSIPECFKDDILNTSYCSNLEWMIQKYKPTLWIHGHIHHKFDYSIGDTRIICNPRGYTPDDLVDGFDPGFVIEI